MDTSTKLDGKSKILKLRAACEMHMLISKENSKFWQNLYLIRKNMEVNIIKLPPLVIRGLKSPLPIRYGD